MVWLDLETFSLEPIASGVYKYAEQSRILLCAYAIDGAPARVVDVARGEPWPAELVAKLRDTFCVLVAHNSNFDRTILRRYFPEVGNPERWLDSMIFAFSLSSAFRRSSKILLFWFSGIQSIDLNRISEVIVTSKLDLSYLLAINRNFLCYGWVNRWQSCCRYLKQFSYCYRIILLCFHTPCC